MVFQLVSRQDARSANKQTLAKTSGILESDPPFIGDNKAEKCNLTLNLHNLTHDFQNLTLKFHRHDR